MYQIPKIFFDVVGKYIDDKLITRLVSMDFETNDIVVAVLPNDSDHQYKVILPIAKTLNLLGYFKDEIKEEIVEEKKKVEDVKFVNTVKGE